jgi:hypothetical protein
MKTKTELKEMLNDCMKEIKRARDTIGFVTHHNDYDCGWHEGQRVLIEELLNTKGTTK